MKIRIHNKCKTKIYNECDNKGQFYCPECGAVNRESTELIEKTEGQAFRDQHRKVIDEMQKLSEMWNADEVKKYPKYLPSFDEFVNEFMYLTKEFD